jgi:uncharacterized membrane protein YfcA
LDTHTIVIIATAFLVAGAIKGAIGAGLPTTSIAIMGAALGLREAVPLLIVPAVASNLWLVVQGGRAGHLFRRFGTMIVMAGIGIWLGTVILYRVEPAPLSAVLGVAVCIYALINLFAFHVHLPGRFERPFSPIVGLVSGLLTGATGSMLLPVLLYLQALGLDKDDFVRTLGQLLLVASLMWAGALVAEGALDGEAAVLSAFALLPTGVGMLAGQWVRGRVSQERFRTGVFVFLLILGLNLLRQAIF